MLTYCQRDRARARFTAMTGQHPIRASLATARASAVTLRAGRLRRFSYGSFEAVRLGSWRRFAANDEFSVRYPEFSPSSKSGRGVDVVRVRRVHFR